MVQLFINFLRKKIFQNSTILQCSFHARHSAEMVFIHDAFILGTVSLFVVCKMICAVHAIFLTLNVKWILTVFSQWLCRRNVILLQIIHICFTQFTSRNCMLTFVYNLFNCIINKNVCVFAFKTRIDVILKMSITIFKHLFCVISSFSSSSFSSLLVGLCQTVDVYVIINFMMIE